MESKGIIAETERLILRRYTKENLEWRIGTDEMIAIELKDSHKMIGNIYLGKREFQKGALYMRRYVMFA